MQLKHDSDRRQFAETVTLARACAALISEKSFAFNEL
jgi:hypothetical protein